MDNKCYNCAFAMKISQSNDVICERKGLITGDSSCKRFKEVEATVKNIRVPKQINYDPNEFTL